MRTFWLVIAVVAGLGLGTGVANAAPAVQSGCPGNMLQNADFDGPSRKTEGEGTSLSSAVSVGWHPWLIRGNESVNREPEYKVEQVAIGGDAYRTRSGGQSMKWFTTWGTHTAGIYQRVPVRPGSLVDFSIYSMIYTGESDGWNGETGTFFSDPIQSGNYRVWVGIDPTGAVPAGVGSEPPATVQWAPPSMTPDQWVRLSIQARAQGPAVTVYTKGQPEWSVKHNNSWWDDACLQVVGAPAAAARAVAGGGASKAAAPPIARRTIPAVKPALSKRGIPR